MDARTPNRENTPGKRQTPGTFRSLVGKLQSALGPEVPAWQQWALGVTLLVDGGLTIGLAVRDFQLATGPPGPLMAAILFALGLVNLLALFSLLRQTPTWHLQNAVAQILIALLALYVIMTAAQHPHPQRGVVAAAAVLGVVAVGWVLRLADTVKVQWNKTATAIVALFPLAGLVQFWLQSDYIPKLTAPLIDVSTDLSPIGRTGDNIHLSAKVSFHNRGTAKVNIAGALMRISAYQNPPNKQPAPPTAQATPSDPDLMGGIDLRGSSGDGFRAVPTLAAQRRLLYAESLGGPGDFLSPGDTVTYQDVVDIDSKNTRLARLYVGAVFFTDRRIRDIRTCFDPQVSWKAPEFQQHGPVLCALYDLAPRNAIQDIVAGDAYIMVYETADDTAGPSEYPSINCVMLPTPRPPADWNAEQQSESEKLASINPALFVEQTAEATPSDNDTTRATTK
jgi:hypothetical protein